MLSEDPRCRTSLGEVLTRESGRQQIDAFGEPCESADVRFRSNTREAMAKNGLGTGVDLTEERRCATCLLQTELKSPYAGEQASDFHG